MKCISPSLFSVFCCRDKKHKRVINLCIKSELFLNIFCHIIRLNHESKLLCLSALVLIDLYLLGQDTMNHFLHPGSLGIQANLLACLFQSGTATPSKKQTCSQSNLMKPASGKISKY